MAETKTPQGMASIGVLLKVNSVEVENVQEIGSVGGKPSDIDVTCLKDRVKRNIPGVKEAASWEVTYLFDNSTANSDYRRIKALEDAGNAVPVEVTYPDGTKCTNTAYVSTEIEGTKVDAALTAKLYLSLQSEWTVTNPSAS